MRQQDLPGLGQGNAARRALQQGHAKLALEREHMLRQRGLGHVDAFRRGRERALLRNHDEVSELSDVHARAPRHGLPEQGNGLLGSA
jgi:hypothetical protein